MRDTRTIIVAGAGIGGLTAALAIARAGFRVVLVERAPVLQEAGAGLQISPNAGHVLDGLGLGAALREAAVEPSAIEVRSGHSGFRLASMPISERCRRAYGFPYLVIHRADLQQILAEAVADAPDIELKLGAELVELGVHENGVTALVETGAGHVDIRGVALIGADGVHSFVRSMMPGGAGMKPAGRTAWRAVIDIDRIPAGLAHEAIGLWLGPDAHFVHYPVRGKRAINVVAIVKDDWTGPGWSEPGDPDWLFARFRHWAPVVRDTLAAAPHWLKWALLTVPPKGRWVEGPVALLGDAAHAMPPFLAQGAAMAIEDAAVLGRMLSRHHGRPEAALAAYAAERRPRVRRVWNASVGNGELYHMGAVTGALRDLGMMAMGGRGLIGRYDWVYRWKPA